jgi:hypothetical protein
MGPVPRVHPDEHIPHEHVPLGHSVEQAPRVGHMDAGRVEIDEPCGEGRVEAESGHEEPRVELSAKTKSLGSDGGSEGGDVAVVQRLRGGEVRGITWTWRRCRD